MTNTVIVIAIGKSKEWEACKPSVLSYCKRYNLSLEVITQPKYGLEPFDKFSNTVNLFEKNQIYELFDTYDRILRLDFDLIITPKCPNLFEIVPEHKIGVVFEDVNRDERILAIQERLGDVNWRERYINAGVVVVSKRHREVFNTTIEEINDIQKIEGIITPEQDYFNYVIRKLGFEIHELSYKFNHIRHFPANRFDSYIIHYAGSWVFDEDLRLKISERVDNELWREMTTIQMKRDYKKLIAPPIGTCITYPLGVCSSCITRINCNINPENKVRGVLNE